ncbi:ParA family protein [methane-oxidizing endosymbiont of Gigantopelta aegis]|uniref:ParA family protein n=1 Tax=methane-oxidizing endosymbiont of Gigantopelta aegis TaxID=2794938 RepID=UPI0018DD9609|nr:ParA family protein [methane-oxidizing endosymbiont of Gigantopelta aegis]
MLIVLSHQKGGVGKSTIAWNLATGLQNKKYAIELVDLDVQQTLFYTNEIRKQNTKLNPLIVKQFGTVNDFKMYIQGDSENRISVIDVGGFDSDMARVAIASADLVITPVSDKNFELLGVKTFEKTLKAISTVINDTVVVKVLLNNLNPRKSKIDDLVIFLNKSSHFELMDSILRTRVDFDRSVGEGKNVIEYDKKSKASKEIKNLIKETIHILNI